MTWLSRPAVLWAFHDAPGVPARLVSTLLAVAMYAGEDGRGAYPSAATVAILTRKTERAAKKDLAELRRLGLLLRGDQRLVKDIRADRRPFVYDLPMPRGEPQDTPPRGERHDTPSAHGVSGNVSRGVRDGTNGVSHSSPEEVLKTSRRGARGDSADAPRPPHAETQAAPLLECPECGRPFSAKLCADPDFRAMHAANEVLCANCAFAQSRCRKCDGELALDDPDDNVCASCHGSNVVPIGNGHSRRRQGLDQDLIAAIAANPGSSSEQLPKLVHATRLNVLNTLKQLAEQGAVVKVRDGRRVSYELAEP